MALGRGVGDEDVCFWGNGAGPGIVMGGVDEGVFRTDRDDDPSRPRLPRRKPRETGGHAV